MSIGCRFFVFVSSVFLLATDVHSVIPTSTFIEPSTPQGLGQPLEAVLVFDNLIVRSILFLIVFFTAVLLFKLLKRSKKNPQAFQFTSKSGLSVTIIFNLILIMLVFLLGWWALTNIKARIKDNMHQSLQTVMQTTFEAMSLWVTEKSGQLNLIATQPEFVTLANQQLVNYQSNRKLLNSSALAELRTYLNEIQERATHLGFFIIAPDGVSVASMRDSNIGQINIIQKKRPQFLQRAFSGEAVMVPPLESDIPIEGSKNIAGSDRPPTSFFLVPIRGADGLVVGVLAERLNPLGNFSRVSRLGRIGKSGETYFFDSQGRLVTESRFANQLIDVGLLKESEQSILSIKIVDPGKNLLNNSNLTIESHKSSNYTLMASSAIAGNSGFNLDGYRDYRGVVVVGVWGWVDALGIGVTTEIDYDELMEPYFFSRNVLIIILTITVIVSILFSMVTIFLARRSDLALLAEHELLEERVEIRTRELQLSEKRAGAANQAKSDFLASMSHEIRTPINGVIGMLSLMQDNELEPAQKQRASIAQSSAKALLTLINDILDFSKVEAGKLELEEIDFSPRKLLNDVIKSLLYKAQEKDVSILLDVIDIECSLVKGDPNRLRQVLTNLIDNAIKFTGEGEILIKAEISMTLDKTLKFKCKVIDPGVGIPQSKLAGLFDSFTQVDSSTTRKFGGTGLGLAICKKLCHLMKGDITVTSQEGQGSCFNFNVEFELSKRSIRVTPAVDISRLKILVVDQSTVSGNILDRQLTVWGARTTLVSAVTAGLKLCYQNKNALFDLVLINTSNPDTEIKKLLSDFKIEPDFSSIKISIVSALTNSQSMKKLLEDNSLEYLAAPVLDEDFFAILHACINSQDLTNIHTTQSFSEKKKLLENERSTLGQKDEPWPKRTKILVVDDNEVNQLVAQGILEQFGLQSETAINGIDALKKLNESDRDYPFSLIFMDCEMPELDGYQTTHKIRNGDAGNSYKNMTIIAMTANAMQGAREKCLNVGMNDYISKPVDGDELLILCKKWITGD